MANHPASTPSIIVDLGPVGAKVWELLHVLYEYDDECRKWLDSRQPLLNNRLPIAMLLKGEGEVVRDFLQAICDGAYL